MRRKNEAGKDKKRELFSYLVNISHLCSGNAVTRLWMQTLALDRHYGLDPQSPAQKDLSFVAQRIVDVPPP